MIDRFLEFAMHLTLHQKYVGKIDEQILELIGSNTDMDVKA